MLDSSIGRLRIISIVEGISFLVLVLVAMPMKYIWLIVTDQYQLWETICIRKMN